jgi:hypothetical protein
MNHKAIRALYSNVVSIDDATGAYDAQGNKVTIDMSAVNAWIDPEAYVFKRVSEYPSIGDQLDAIWKGGDAKTEMLAKVMAVKTKYPKGQA